MYQVTLEGDIFCETADEAIKLSEKIRSRTVPGHNSRQLRSDAHGQNGSSRNGYRITGSSARWLSHMLSHPNKPVPEAELLKLFGYTERRKLGGVKTGLGTSLRRAGTDFDQTIEQKQQGDELAYAFRPGAAEKIRGFLEG